MKRIGYFIGIAVIAGALLTSYAVKTTFASSCCEKKNEAASEQTDTKCVVCGKAIEKGKGVKVECEGNTVILCCDSCETVFKKDPCKFCKDEKCEKRKETPGEKPH